ncbi:MAG: response regulator transcription factor [Bacteroidetes bacterium]|nr:response regulator transcription factor [Bacteroidota bacterium]
MKILIADDHRLFADGLRGLIASEPDLTVVGQVSDGDSVLDFVQKHPPELVLMDINMPRRDGFETASLLLRHYPRVKVIMLTMYADAHYVNECRKLGVHGYLLKNCTPDVLLEALRRVGAGERFYDKNVKRTPVLDDAFTRKHQLTKREVEVIGLLKKGLSSQGIADRLFLSVNTIESHRKNIYFKLGINSLAELVRFAVENGL